MEAVEMCNQPGNEAQTSNQNWSLLLVIVMTTILKVILVKVMGPAENQRRRMPALPFSGNEV